MVTNYRHGIFFADLIKDFFIRIKNHGLRRESKGVSYKIIILNSEGADNNH